MKRLGLIGLLIVATAGLSACVPGRAKQSTTVNSTTTGQQLTDLKAALDAGAISPEEYEKKRKEILKKKG
jgi:putative oligomerization/nucleic acid binding protein